MGRGRSQLGDLHVINDLAKAMGMGGDPWITGPWWQRERMLEGVRYIYCGWGGVHALSVPRSWRQCPLSVE